MAIIDILTHYDAKKKAAHAAKTVKHGVSISTVSFSAPGPLLLSVVWGPAMAACLPPSCPESVRFKSFLWGRGGVVGRVTL